MIKRRFYKLEHGDGDAPSESSSSSDTDAEADASNSAKTEIDEEEVAESNVVSELRKKREASSSSSGYESEDSSANEVNLDASGLPSSDDDMAAQNGMQSLHVNVLREQGDSILAEAPHNPDTDESRPDVKDCILKIKSVFKCRLCPRVVCLSEETLKAHLNSKRHARSERLYSEGRLKLVLNAEGQLEGQSDPENHPTSQFPGQSFARPKKKSSGRWKLKKRSRQVGKGWIMERT